MRRTASSVRVSRLSVSCDYGVTHILSLTFSVVVNFIQQLVSLTQKSNWLLKTWLTKTPVSPNKGEVTLLVLGYISKRKDFSSVSNNLLVFHSHFS